MCTKRGVIKKTTLEAYSRPRTNGIHAIGIREGDELLEAKLTNGNNEILLAIKSGRAIRFNESKVRSMGRTASGVRGITLTSDKDEVIGMVCVEDFSNTILVVSENGYGKRTLLNDPETGDAIYRITNRGGKGVKTLTVTEKTGNLVAIKVVTDDDDLMIINKSGITIRMHVADLRTQGRATQGVKLINLKGKDQIAAVAKVERDEDDNSENQDADSSNDVDNTEE
jgi:DNA gyrase subunit A